MIGHPWDVSAVQLVDPTSSGVGHTLIEADRANQIRNQAMKSNTSTEGYIKHSNSLEGPRKLSGFHYYQTKEVWNLWLPEI